VNKAFIDPNIKANTPQETTIAKIVYIFSYSLIGAISPKPIVATVENANEKAEM
jgi:hypothetical protein